MTVTGVAATPCWLHWTREAPVGSFSLSTCVPALTSATLRYLEKVWCHSKALGGPGVRHV